jgi:diguanylate cyclase (GGDEF)-like protein/PAS domain S-box-containing protein
MDRILSCLTVEHDLRLVVLAGVLCFLASLTAINLFYRARSTRGRARRVWILIAGVTAGCGIWATHFIAMLAYEPGVGTAYNIGLTALSLVAAMGVTSAGLGFAAVAPIRWGAPIGGAIVGGGIAGMHYLGMSALELPGHIHWSLDLVFVSVLLGVAFGAGALLTAAGREDVRATLAAGLLLTLAIISHHFTAMGAIELVPDPTRITNAMAIAPTTLAVAIAAVTVVMLAISLVGTIVDEQFREQSVYLDAALNNMRQGLLMFNAEGRLVLVNHRFIVMYNLSRGSIKLGCTLRDVLQLRKEAGTFKGNPDQYVAKFADQDGRFRGDPDTNKFVEEGVEHKVFDLPDGRSISITNQTTPGGGWISTHTDISDTTRATKELHSTKTFLDTVIENVPATLIVKNAHDHRYVLINRAGEQMLGLSREQMFGKTAHDFFPRKVADAICALDQEVLTSGRQMVVENNPVETPDGQKRLLRTKRLAIPGDDGKPQYLLDVIEDVTERKRAEDRIAYMAHHDALTDLPNRAAFTERLASTIEQATKTSGNFAVLSIDLDRFKEVNDVFGHSVGDLLLREVSRRLHAAAEEAFLARLGGDEFTLIVEDGPQPATAETLAERLLNTVVNDFELDGNRLRIGLSIGVAIFPSDGTDATTLVANADAALYHAKSQGCGIIRFFDADMDQRLRERRALQHELRSAIPGDQLILHSQPQAKVEGEIIGFEALVRWQHPTRGLVPPNSFIPVAEESGLILPIGEWIMREACREAASWPKPLQIAVNLSPIQFRHGDLAGLVHQVLLDTGLSPGRLELEITEGVLIGDFSRAISILRRLKALGVRIAMDDFGTGYSSLSYLQSFPFDKIKIDRTFIANLDRNPQSAAIIRAVIGLGHGLGLPIMAEGVETSEQLAFLSGEACNEVQGFFLGRPLSIESYDEFTGRKGAGVTRDLRRAI